MTVRQNIATADSGTPIGDPSARLIFLSVCNDWYNSGNGGNAYITTICTSTIIDDGSGGGDGSSTGGAGSTGGGAGGQGGPGPSNGGIINGTGIAIANIPFNRLTTATKLEATVTVKDGQVTDIDSRLTGVIFGTTYEQSTWVVTNVTGLNVYAQFAYNVTIQVVVQGLGQAVTYQGVVQSIRINTKSGKITFL